MATISKCQVEITILISNQKDNTVNYSQLMCCNCSFGKNTLMITTYSVVIFVKWHCFLKLFCSISESDKRENIKTVIRLYYAKFPFKTYFKSNFFRK